MDAIKARLVTFWNKPFDTNMNVVGWALFFLLLVVISIFWKMVLSHIVSNID